MTVFDTNRPKYDMKRPEKKFSGRFMLKMSGFYERNRKKIQQSDYIKEDKINELFDEYEDLLIDKLKNDPDLWEKIQKQIGQ